MSREKYASCSEVGRAVYCAHSLKLKAQGYKPSQDAHKRMERGELSHQQFNETLAQDKRCFIATACFGIDHPATQFFRDFRDDNLKHFRIGRGFIYAYYKASPYLVKLIRKSPWSLALSRSLLLLLKKRMEQTNV